MRTDAAARGHRRRRSRGGATPIAVVATVGTTSTTSVDPVDEIADVCARARRLAARRRGVRRRRGHGARVRVHLATASGSADSIVVNPHKWLFTPFDLSAFYCRRMDVVRQAFSLVPEYLQTGEGDAGVRNLMDTGIQLGRRFRALKLWMVLRHFGAEGLRGRLAEHMRLARLFAEWVDASHRLRTPRACALQRRLLPRHRADADRRAARRVESAADGRGERSGPDLHLAHENPRTCFAAARDRESPHRRTARNRCVENTERHA